VKVGRFEVYLDGKRFRAVVPTGPTCRFRLNFAKATDGYHELRIVAVSAGPMQAESSSIVGFTVNNHGKQIAVSCPKKTCRWGETISLQAGLAGAKRIEIRQNDRMLACADAASLTVEIDSRRLGMGPVRLFAVAVLAPDKAEAGRVVSRPVELQIEPPEKLSAIQVPKSARFAPGLRITPAGGKAVFVKDLSDVFAAEKQAKVGKGKAFTARAHFDVAADGLYQFQIHLPGAVSLQVDSRRIPVLGGAGWRFVPVHLAKGTHRFALSARPTGRPRLDLRFGLRGARTVDGKRFRALLAE
jgi:hypothetical protein